MDPTTTGLADAAHGTDRRVVLHVDMDAFFAAVELRRRPELRGRRMMVGGTERGVVVSATYEARADGVRSGMPMSRARRLSPRAVVIPPSHGLYRDVSRQVLGILDDYTDLVEIASIDEAFLDITGAIRRLGPPARIGAMLRARVAEEQGLTCTVGIAPNKFVAKVASTSAKPDGLLVVPPDRVLSFLHPLPVERMWGVGPATAERLHRLGLRTIADIAGTPVDSLVATFGRHHGHHLAELARGHDPRPVVRDEQERSIGSEETFPEDLDDPDLVRRELLRMADRTAARLRRAGLVGRTVSIVIRLADFTTVTRSARLAAPTDVTGEIHDQAVALHARLLRTDSAVAQARIRLVGVRVEGLQPRDEAHRQPTLDEPDRGWRDAEEAIDRAVARYGDGAVHRAVLGERGHRDTGPR